MVLWAPVVLPATPPVALDAAPVELVSGGVFVWELPEMLPEELSARPLGREPLPSDQLYGVVPPAAVSVALKAADTVAPGSCVVVICRVGEAALTVRVAALLVTLPLALLTTTVKREPLSEAVVAGVV